MLGSSQWQVEPALRLASVGGVWLISFLAWETWLRFALWFLIGAVVYFGYGIRRSTLARTSETAALPGAE